MSTGTIYIVDDDSAVRLSTAFFLNAVGFVTRQFADGPEFLDSVDDLAPGCVLLDVRMPGMDGLEVLAQLAERGARLPVVVVTGHGDVTTAVHAMQLGALDFLEKPFEEDVVLAVLARVFATLEDRVRDDSRRRDAEARIARLSEREREVLDGLIAGSGNKVLAFEIGISVRTVEMHRAGMMERLGVRTFAEALRLAFDAGVVSDVSARPAVGRAA